MRNSHIPSAIYEKDFTRGRKGAIGAAATFKVIPRSHLRQMTVKEKVDGGLYTPRFNLVE
jgi:hypothetical protein